MTVFFHRLQDGLASFVQLGELLKSIPDRGDGYFIEAASGFLAVARDERYGGAIGEEVGGLLDLCDVER